jgi:hypothetical protein
MPLLLAVRSSGSDELGLKDLNVQADVAARCQLRFEVHSFLGK